MIYGAEQGGGFEDLQEWCRWGRTRRAGAGGEKRKKEETGGQSRAGVVLKGSEMRGGR